MTNRIKDAIQNLIDTKTPVFRWIDEEGWAVIDTKTHGVSMKTLRKYAVYDKTPCENGEILVVTGWRS